MSLSQPLFLTVLLFAPHLHQVEGNRVRLVTYLINQLIRLCILVPTAHREAKIGSKSGDDQLT